MERQWKRGLGKVRRGAQEVPDLVRRPRFRMAVLSGIGALVALGIGSSLGNLRSNLLHEKVIAATSAAAFVILAVLAVRSTASELFSLFRWRANVGSATAVRLLTMVVGLVIVVFVTLGMLDIPVAHLLLGGAITGVVLGIAGQQSLGNLFAGIVLLITRPFSPGDRVRIRSGAMGGEMTGVITDMGLTYLSLRTDAGLLKLPNSGVLAAAVGKIPAEPAAASTPEPAAASTPEPAAASTPEPAAASTPEPAAASTPEPAAASTAAPSQSNESAVQGAADPPGGTASSPQT